MMPSHPTLRALRRALAATFAAALCGFLGGCGKSAPADEAAAAPAGGEEKIAELTAQNNLLLAQNAAIYADLRVKEQRLRDYEDRMGRIRPGLTVIEGRSNPVGDRFETRIVLGASAPTDLSDCRIKLVFTKPLIAGDTGCFIIGPKNDNVPKPEASISDESILNISLSTLPANQYLVIVAYSKEKADVATAEVSPAPQAMQ